MALPQIEYKHQTLFKQSQKLPNLLERRNSRKLRGVRGYAKVHQMLFVKSQRLNRRRPRQFQS